MSSKVDATTISVVLEEDGHGVVHAGVTGVAPHATALAGTFEHHIAHKARQAQQHGDKPFFLLYVRPFGYGAADMGEYAMATALRGINENAAAIANSGLWLGSLLFDWAPGQLARLGLIRPDARWPVELDDAGFAQSLGVRQWPLVLA